MSAALLSAVDPSDTSRAQRFSYRRTGFVLRKRETFLGCRDQLTDSGDAEKTAAPMTIAPVKTILRIPGPPLRCRQSFQHGKPEPNLIKIKLKADDIRVIVRHS
jgi:hypothetical protein